MPAPSFELIEGGSFHALDASVDGERVWISPAALERATGWVLTGLPFATGTGLMMINPDYMMEMFQPGWPLLIPAGAIITVIIGNIVMRWVMKVEY